MTKNINNNDITKSRNAKDTKVAIFMNSYGRRKLTNEHKEILYNHCKIHNYEIVSTFSYKQKVSITELYEEITKKAKELNFTKIVVQDFREICLNALKLISLTEMLKDFGIEIEIVGCFYLLDSILSNNVFIETYFQGQAQDSYASFYDKEDYFYFMEELEYQQVIELIRLNQDKEIETRRIYSKVNDLEWESEEWHKPY